MVKYERKQLYLSTNGFKSVTIQLVTNMKTGQSHLELSEENTMRLSVDKLSQAKGTAQLLMDKKVNWEEAEEHLESIPMDDFPDDLIIDEKEEL